jgi:hypothetical protein
MKFAEVVEQAVTWLQREGRVSYQALKREFDLDDEFLADVRNRTLWKLMVERVKTVQTQSCQVWLSQNMEQVGWTLPQIDFSAYVKPFDTWADLRQLIDREQWPAEQKPLSMAYFCNVMPTPHSLPPASDPTFPITQGNIVKGNAIQGDWIDCGFNAGCVEAAVMVGMEASHAICGSPKLAEIIGYKHP